MKGKGSSYWAVALCAFVLAALTLVPFYWLIRSAFMTQRELYLYPPLLWTARTRLNNLIDVFVKTDVLRLFSNTLVILIPSLIGTVITSSMSAYAFARIRFPFRNFWFACVVGSMLVPSAVTMIPLFLVWSRLHGVNTFLPLIVPLWFGGGAFNVFLLRQFMLSLPLELEEAAFLDGAGYWTIYTKIILPLMKPALVVVAMFTFMAVWNDFLTPMIYLNNERFYTLALGLNQFIGSYSSKYNLLMAFAIVMIIPPLIVFFIGQKSFIQGNVMSGLKM